MTGWFTTWTFWVGAIWGASAMAVGLTHWLIEPMGKLLGFDRRVSAGGGVGEHGTEEEEGGDA